MKRDIVKVCINKTVLNAARVQNKKRKLETYLRHVMLYETIFLNTIPFTATTIIVYFTETQVALVRIIPSVTR